MKKVETKYYCDVCGEEINENILSVRMPRHVRVYARDKLGAKLHGFEQLRARDMDLCKNCAEKIALSFPVIDEEIDEGYMD